MPPALPIALNAGMSNGLARDHARVVVLVDDSREFLRHATSFLRAHGVMVVGAFDDAETALAEMAVQAPEVAVVDLRMRGTSGLEAINRLRELAPALGIVALTLAAASGYRRAALAAGADEFVDKAHFDSDLLPAIDRAAAARRHLEASR